MSALDVVEIKHMVVSISSSGLTARISTNFFPPRRQKAGAGLYQPLGVMAASPLSLFFLLPVLFFICFCFFSRRSSFYPFCLSSSLISVTCFFFFFFFFLSISE
jgi:hypothetical protein